MYQLRQLVRGRYFVRKLLKAVPYISILTIEIPEAPLSMLYVTSISDAKKL